MNGKRLAVAATAFMLTTLFATAPASAQQPAEFYAGKTLRILVGLEAGGTVDTWARRFAAQLRKHIPGQPNVILQNMPSAAGVGATNFLYEKAEPDGLTILFNSWDPLAQALGDQGLRARYDHFEFLGGIGDVRVIYARTAAVPGGMKTPADLVKADNLIVGSLNYTNQSGLLPDLALATLDLKHRVIVGFRGGSDVFLAMQRGEVDVHSTSIASFRTRNAGFIKSGAGLGIAYLVPVDANGHYQRNKLITEMPAFPDLYQEIRGKMPSGKTWEAFNWLTNQIGEMTYIAVAPPHTPAGPLAALRKGFEGVAHDEEFEKEMLTQQGMSYSHIGPEQGAAIFRSLTDVSPDIMSTVRTFTNPSH
jgi:hypothetical protein